jgi:hypothetical protein
VATEPQNAAAANPEGDKKQRQRPKLTPMAGITDRPLAEPGRAKVKTTMELSAEALERLHIHARKFGVSHSELLEELINTGLRRFYVADKGATSGEAA